MVILKKYEPCSRNNWSKFHRQSWKGSFCHSNIYRQRMGVTFQSGLGKAANSNLKFICDCTCGRLTQAFRHSRDTSSWRTSNKGCQLGRGRYSYRTCLDCRGRHSHGCRHVLCQYLFCEWRYNPISKRFRHFLSKSFMILSCRIINISNANSWKINHINRFLETRPRGREDIGKTHRWVWLLLLS